MHGFYQLGQIGFLCRRHFPLAPPLEVVVVVVAHYRHRFRGKPLAQVGRAAVDAHNLFRIGQNRFDGPVAGKKNLDSRLLKNLLIGLQLVF